MTTQSKRTVAFALCGSFCSFAAVLPQLRVLTARGWDVLPILRAGYPLRHSVGPAADLI